MRKHLWVTALAAALSTPVWSLNIVVSNDDGLSSNLKALYEALKADGHDVIVSVPCTGQSGRGMALVMYSKTVIVPDEDRAQITREGGCHNGAAPVGAPAAGPFLKPGYTQGDYHYVHGTPVMATAYALDILAPQRWGKAPDLVLSGPNEGHNAGRIITSSGTVGNAQFAAMRGIPAIALSAHHELVDNTHLAHPGSTSVAQRSLDLVKTLQKQADNNTLLPNGVVLNVNFPRPLKPDTPWAFARVGSFNLYEIRFQSDASQNPPTFGLGYSYNPPQKARAEQSEDEWLVAQDRIAVSVLQVGLEHNEPAHEWWRQRMPSLNPR